MAPPRAHYISNEQLYQALIVYRTNLVAAKQARQEGPPLPDYLGESFLKIADRLARKPNFASYTFREDMIADAVNFDPAKSHNPFSYFTQIIYFAFLRRISREKKHLYVKYKAMELQGMDHPTVGQTEEGVPSGAKVNLYDNIQEFIHTFETTHEQKKKDESTKAAKRKQLLKKETNKHSRIKNHLTMLFV
mgnify:CR=1 FL=1